MKFYKYLIMSITLLSISCASSETRENTPRKVKCERARLTSYNTEHITLPGKVVAATDVNIGFRVPGIVEEICVTDGSFVRKGDVVARLDSRDYELQVSATQAEYDAVKAEVDRVVALFADESISANDYDKATNGLRAITAKLEAHSNALYDTDLRAPFDGYIQRNNFDRGEAVAAGTPVIVLISATAPEVTVDIPAAYYIKQKNFEGATASIEIFPNKTFDLRLKGISPKANLNQLYRITFSIEGADGILPSAGVSAMVKMTYTAPITPSTTIPFTAIVEQNGENFVWVVTNGQAKSRSVVVAKIQNGMALITEGLEEGEIVITAGVNSLKENEQVTQLKEPSASNVGGLK